MRNWNRDDPVADAEDYAQRGPFAIGHCEECGDRIYRDVSHIEMDGIYLCDDTECINAYVRRNYLKEV